MKKFIPFIIMLALAIVSLMYSNMVTQDKQTQLALQVSEYDRLQSVLTVKNSSIAAESQRVVEQATGLVETRKATDDKIASAFVSDIVTWSSYAEYMQKREDSIAKYSLDDAFLKIFFPPVTVTVAADGTEYNTIDVYALSLTLNSITSYVTQIESDVYTYFTVCEVANLSNGGEGYSRFTIMYSIDTSGKISNIKGIL